MRARSARIWELVGVPEAEPCSLWTVEGAGQLSLARRGARQVLAAAATPVPVETAELVVLVLDELASNALRHGGDRATVELCQHDDGWLVVATDTAPGQLPAPPVHRPPEQGGMGLKMVATMTQRHGTDVDAERKRVWALVAG